MTLLVAIGVVAALLAGFLWLTSVERKKGARIFPRLRGWLDRKAEGLAALVHSEEARASVERVVRRAVDYIVHEIVHAVLQAVRLIERILTRAAREIRGRRARESGAEGIE